SSLFLWPAGLAVGLAPKERRYGPAVRFAPGTAFDAAPLVPPLRHGQGRGGFGRFSGRRQYSRGVGGVRKPEDARRGGRRSTIIRRPRPILTGGGFSSSARADRDRHARDEDLCGHTRQPPA